MKTPSSPRNPAETATTAAAPPDGLPGQHAVEQGDTCAGPPISLTPVRPGTTARDLSSSFGQRAGMSRDMARFAAWCATAQVSSLPAAPATVLAYLEAEQPSRRTAARWVAGIRAAHLADGLSDPCGGSVVTWVRGRRRPAEGPAGETAAQLGWLAALLPEGGWPAGIFGRRDRLAFLLNQLGSVPAATMVRLRASALTVSEPRAVHLEHDGQVWAVLARPGAQPAACPACAALRWAWVLRVAAEWDRRQLETVLARAVPDTSHACAKFRAGAGEWPAGWPLFPPCNQWGYFPSLPVPAMSLRALEGALRAARAGAATYREQAPPRRGRDPWEDLLPALPAQTGAALDPPAPARDWREAGLAARATELKSLVPLDKILDDLDVRASAVAERARQLLDDALGEDG